MPSNRTATKARAISRNRSIIGCPLTGNSLGRRLTVDGVDNKANGRFCRAGRYGDGSALVVFLNPVFRLGTFGSARGSSRCSHRAGCRRDLVPRAPWQIGHTAGAISAAPQEVAVAALGESKQTCLAINAKRRYEIETLLPWQAAGTLSRRDAHRVEQALADD